MRKTLHFIMMFVLLLAAGTTAALAQKSDKISFGDCEMQYTFGGGELTTDVKKHGDEHDVYHSYGCRIGQGGTISLSGSKLKGPDSLKTIIIEVRFNKRSPGGYYNPNTAPQKKEIFKDGSGNLRIKIPEGTETVDASITFKSRRRDRTVPGGYSGKDLVCKVTWYVKAGAPTQPTQPTQPPKPDKVKPENYKGTYERHGGKMEYSFTNCKVTSKKDDLKFKNYDLHPYHNSTTGGASIGSYIKGNVKPGATMALACKKVKGNTTLDSVMIQVEAMDGNTPLIKKTYKGKGAMSQSIKVPKNADRVSVCLAYAYLDATFSTRIDLDVTEELPDVPGSRFKWNTVADDDRCKHCQGKWSEYTINWGSSSEYAVMCNSEKKWHKYDIDSRDVTNIFYNDHIATNGERLTLSKGETHNNYNREEELIFRGNTHAWLRKRLDDGTDRWSFYKGFIIGKHLKRSGKPSSSFETDELVVVPKGTIYILEKDDDATKAYLLNGSMEVTNKKDKKKVTLTPGQVATGTKNGQMKVQTFDVNAMAAKYGITLNGTVNTGLTFKFGNLHYKILSEKTVEVTGEVRSVCKGRIEIPNQVTHSGKTYQVVGIGKNAFADQTQMTSIVIPKTIHGIAENAFRNTGLEEVMIPGDKVSIVKNAFLNSKKLTLAVVSGKEPKCSADAFTGCSSMKELRIRGISPSNNGKKLNGTNAVIKVIK